MLALDFTHDEPSTPRDMRFSSTAPSASENPMVILTRLSFKRSGTMEIDVAVGGVVSITTEPRAVAELADCPFNDCEEEKLQVPSLNSLDPEKVHDS